eukprot:TRINITY_DN3439_c0_g1_i1.p1 TRINITY_DN3439_c0_g1~~TRINITY_DN3439_c0_g1_i1.p1  ORF type:complete len:302 (-),score=60.48 TRINITY_DN3439_c0_g1_i1:108-926(-)
MTDSKMALICGEEERVEKVEIKLFYTITGEIRRFMLENNEKCYNGLIGMLRRISPDWAQRIVARKFLVSYKDDEEDFIHVSTNEELRYFFKKRAAWTNSDLVRLYITPRPRREPKDASVKTLVLDQKCVTNTFAKGDRIIFQSMASKRSLRILSDGKVDGNGGKGKWARFDIFSVRQDDDGSQYIKLRNVGDPKHFLRLSSKTLNGNGGGGIWTEFKVHKNPNGPMISLESVKKEGHVGILPTGSPKDPSKTGRGLHGQFKAFRLSSNPAKQ